MEKVYRKSARVVEREIGGERVLVPLASTEQALDSLYVLNGTASLVWNFVIDGQTASHIAELLVREFEVSRSEALADVQETISALLDVGALEEA